MRKPSVKNSCRCDYLSPAQQGMFLNVVAGMVGALLGGWLLAPLLDTGTINQNGFSASLLAVPFLGSLILLMIVNLFRHG